MARKPTDKQLFKMKNEWLEQFYEEVKPMDFYRAVFPEGSFEREGHPEDEKCNGVLTVIEGEKARNYIVFDELNMVDEVKGKEFAIMSPVGYSGRNRTAKNARWLYGIAIDLDGVEMEQLRDVFHQMKHDLRSKRLWKWQMNTEQSHRSFMCLQRTASRSFQKPPEALKRSNRSFLPCRTGKTPYRVK